MDILTIAACALGVVLAVINAAFFSTYKARRAASVAMALIMLVVAAQQTYLGASGVLARWGVDVSAIWFHAPFTLAVEVSMVVSLGLILSIILLSRRED